MADREEMKKLPVVYVNNLSRALPSPLKLDYCDTFLSRLRGLTFRRSLSPDQGILLVQSKASRLDSAIHMLGVFIDLAVIWLDEDCQVVDQVLARKWRLIYFPNRPARYIIEISATRLQEFRIGDELIFEEVVES